MTNFSSDTYEMYVSDAILLFSLIFFSQVLNKGIKSCRTHTKRMCPT